MAGTHQLWGYDPNYDRTGVVAGSGREGLVDGPAVQADLAQPSGLASLGRLLGFVDAETSSLRVLAPADRGGVEVATVVGTGLFDWGDRDGSIGEARLQHPTGIAALAHGFVVSDTFNHRLRNVHMETGTVTTIAGSSPGFRDGVGADARFFEPGGIARIDDVLIVADTGNHALRRVDLQTGRGHEPAADGARATRRRRPRASSRRRSPRTRSSRCSSRSRRRRARTSTRAAGRRSTCASAPTRATRSAPRRRRPPPRSRPPSPCARAAGSGTLRIEIRGAFCDDAQGEGAACRIAESAYVVPFTLEPGARTRLTLE